MDTGCTITHVSCQHDVGIAAGHVGPGHKTQLHLIRTRQDSLGHPPCELGVVALDLRAQHLYRAPRVKKEGEAPGMRRQQGAGV